MVIEKLTDDEREEILRINHKTTNKNCSICFLLSRLDQIREEFENFENEIYLNCAP